MGPLLSLYSALVGFFAFASIYHLILWSSSRRATLLAVFSIDCGLLALLSGVLVTLMTSETPDSAQNALWARLSLGALMSITWLWSMSLVSGVRANWFVWPVTAMLVVVFAVNTFVIPLTSSVLSVERIAMPWGEMISQPQLGPAGWWFFPILVLIFAIYCFCMVCGQRVWIRDRVVGTFILLIGSGLILNGVLEALRVARELSYPAYGGAVVQVAWVCAIAILIARDHRRERELSVVNEQRFRNIFDQTFQLMGLIRTDGTVIAANRIALEFAGIREEDVIGQLYWKTPWWSHSPELRDRLRQAVKDAAGGRMVRFEATHLDRDGKLVYVDFSLKPAHGDRGEISQLIAEGRDVTERRRVEETLQMMRFSIDHAGDSVFWISREGQILYANNRACSDRDYSPNELVGMTIFDLDVEPDDQPETWEKHFDDLRRRGTITLETRHRTKGGRIFPVEVNANYVHIGDKEFSFEFFRDVSGRKRIEEELLASRQRLEGLSRQLITTQETERRHLARELHDEIGQVLTAIKMNLRRTQRAVDGTLKVNLEENVSMVDQAIVQVRNLALSLRPPQLDELGLVAALHWLVKQQASNGNFEDQLDVDLGDVEISAETQTVCFRIAQEALTNAIRHGKPSKVQMKLWVTDNRLFLSIHDNGRGFDVTDVRRRGLEGSNFGLISMQERASLAAGHAKIESTPGHGTTIHAWIPL